MTKYLATLAALITMTSCGEETESKQKQAPEVVVEKACTYAYNNEATKVRWTAYKHTAKNPVGGQFDSFETTAKEGNSANELLNSLEMTIDASTINTKDTARDNKLVAFFFDVMANNGTISGKIKSTTETMGIMAMKMNNVEQDIDFEYVIDEDNLVELRATIDVLNFQGDTALASIGKVCEAKHTGGDGKVKLWSEVAIYITTRLDKTCE